MLPKIRTPYFETGIKNYIYGEKTLEFAKVMDAAAKEYDIDVLFIVPVVDLRMVVENTENLIIIASYMDTIRPGRGMADVLPEGLKAAGAQGVVINHSERPMTLTQIKQTIDRAHELDMLAFACSDTIAEARAIAELGPDIMNPEQTELIGTGKTSDMSYVIDTNNAIYKVNPNIIVEQAAGITCGQQVYDFIMAGSQGAGAASGIFNAKDPYAAAEEMVAAVRRAADDLAKREKNQ